jgi:hypothetical protein
MKKSLFIIALFLLAACSPQEKPVQGIPVIQKTDEGMVGSIDMPKPVIPPVVRTIVPPIVPPIIIPSTINLDVPFFPQAPDGDWSLPWQEACEEAASVMAYYYVSGKPLTKEQFKKDILGLIEWEKKNFGDYKDTDIAQTEEMIRGYFGYQKLEIIENPTVEQMKQFLSEKRAIIAPFAGRELKNPYYTNLGPVYHMMVIKGYDEKNFITNDNGTRMGHDYLYPYETIMSAMHEWNEENIDLGAKNVIVMSIN